MKTFFLLCTFFSAVISSYSQVTTDPKKQPGNISTNDKTKIKTASLVPLCYGKVAADGTIISGTGNFTISKPTNPKGWYTILCKGITEKSIVFANASVYPYHASYGFHKDPELKLMVTIRKVEGDFIPRDAEFQFIIYNP